MERPAVIITGAAGGLGRQAVTALRQREVDVTCLDVVESDLGALIESFGSCAAQFQILTGDLSGEESVCGVIASVKQQWGRLDGIFNTAAVLGTPARLIDVDTAVFDAVMATNVRGTWLMMKHGIPLMLESGGGGAIVNVGSYNAIRGGRAGACAGRDSGECPQPWIDELRDDHRHVPASRWWGRRARSGDRIVENSPAAPRRASRSGGHRGLAVARCPDSPHRTGHHRRRRTIGRIIPDERPTATRLR
jgi:NAD(P)-dependent dehydrogenase (short-subunit alcohol dehydrogenase family)